MISAEVRIQTKTRMGRSFPVSGTEKTRFWAVGIQQSTRRPRPARGSRSSENQPLESYPATQGRQGIRLIISASSGLALRPSAPRHGHLPYPLVPLLALDTRPCWESGKNNEEINQLLQKSYLSPRAPLLYTGCFPICKWPLSKLIMTLAPWGSGSTGLEASVSSLVYSQSCPGPPA